MQDSNDHIYEFKMIEHKVVGVKSQALKKERIAKYVNKKIAAHHKESITKKRNISSIVLLPEQIRTQIHTHVNQFFISPLDAVKWSYKTNVGVHQPKLDNYHLNLLLIYKH